MDNKCAWSIILGLLIAIRGALILHLCPNGTLLFPCWNRYDSKNSFKARPYLALLAQIIIQIENLDTNVIIWLGQNHLRGGKKYLKISDGHFRGNFFQKISISYIYYSNLKILKYKFHISILSGLTLLMAERSEALSSLFLKINVIDLWNWHDKMVLQSEWFSISLVS